MCTLPTTLIIEYFNYLYLNKVLEKKGLWYSPPQMKIQVFIRGNQLWLKNLCQGFVSVKETLCKKKPFIFTDRVHNVCAGSFRLLQTKQKTVREWRQIFCYFISKFSLIPIIKVLFFSGYLSFLIWFCN